MKYAIYSQSLKQFFLTYQGKGMYWKESDFGDLMKARLYTSKAAALSMAESLDQFQPAVVPVQLLVDLGSAEALSSVADKCKEYLPNVLKIDTMNDKETESLPNKVWKEYKAQRRFLLENCTEYNSK